MKTDEKACRKAPFCSFSIPDAQRMKTRNQGFNVLVMGTANLNPGVTGHFVYMNGRCDSYIGRRHHFISATFCSASPSGALCQTAHAQPALTNAGATGRSVDIFLIRRQKPIPSSWQRPRIHAIFRQNRFEQAQTKKGDYNDENI
jgi:hypothetical protein